MLTTPNVGLIFFKLVLYSAMAWHKCETIINKASHYTHNPKGLYVVAAVHTKLRRVPHTYTGTVKQTHARTHTHKLTRREGVGAQAGKDRKTKSWKQNKIKNAWKLTNCCEQFDKIRPSSQPTWGVSIRFLAHKRVVHVTHVEDAGVDNITTRFFY